MTSGRCRHRMTVAHSDNRDMRHIWRPKRWLAGFSMTELMIVVAVATVLLTVAVPTFQDTLRKSRRADAITALSQLQLAQERVRGQQTTYAAAVASMPGSASATSPERYYDLTVDNASASSYTMTATASASSPQYADAKCRGLRVMMASGVITYASVNSVGDVDTTNTNRCWPR